MADCLIETNDGALILHLSGDLTIDYSDQLRSILIRSLRVANRIEIDVTAVTAIDTACLQLFCAAHKTSVPMNKSVVLPGMPAGLRQTVRQAGFTRTNGCMSGKAIPCIWQEERDHE